MNRPDPRDFKNLLTRPDPTREILKPLDPTRPDPVRFLKVMTRPDPTRPAGRVKTRESPANNLTIKLYWCSMCALQFVTIPGMIEVVSLGGSIGTDTACAERRWVEISE